MTSKWGIVNDCLLSAKESLEQYGETGDSIYLNRARYELAQAEKCGPQGREQEYLIKEYRSRISRLAGE